MRLGCYGAPFAFALALLGAATVPTRAAEVPEAFAEVLPDERAALAAIDADPRVARAAGSVMQAGRGRRGCGAGRTSGPPVRSG